MATGQLKKGNFQALKEISEADLILAMKHIPVYRTVEKAVLAAVESKECISSSVLTALGLRVENEFPKVEFRELASRLYDKAIQCGEPSTSVHAAYRLGLLRIWEKRCDSAEEVLSKIGDSEYAQDFRMRIAYWRAYCADQSHKNELKEELIQRVKKEFPLSLHALVLSTPAQIKTESNPQIRFRSSLDPRLSHIVRGVELLLQNKENRAAGFLLEANTSRTLKTEIPFQLYWAVLLKRANLEIPAFQVMANIFRSDSTMIAKDTLERCTRFIILTHKGTLKRLKILSWSFQS